MAKKSFTVVIEEAVDAKLNREVEAFTVQNTVVVAAILMFCEAGSDEKQKMVRRVNRREWAKVTVEGEAKLGVNDAAKLASELEQFDQERARRKTGAS